MFRELFNKLFGRRVLKDINPEFLKGYAYCSKMWNSGATLKELNGMLLEDTSNDDFRNGFVKAKEEIDEKVRSNGWKEIERPEVNKHGKSLLW